MFTQLHIMPDSIQQNRIKRYLHYFQISPRILPFCTSIFHTCIFQYLQFQRSRAKRTAASDLRHCATGTGCNLPLTSTKLIAVGRLRSGVRVSASFQIFALTAGGMC